MKPALGSENHLLFCDVSSNDTRESSVFHLFLSVVCHLSVGSDVKCQDLQNLIAQTFLQDSVGETAHSEWFYLHVRHLISALIMSTTQEKKKNIWHLCCLEMPTHVCVLESSVHAVSQAAAILTTPSQMSSLCVHIRSIYSLHNELHLKIMMMMMI